MTDKKDRTDTLFEITENFAKIDFLLQEEIQKLEKLRVNQPLTN